MLSSKSRTARRSPLKASPLHNPGESVGRYMKELSDLDMNFYLVVGCCVFSFILFEWIQYFAREPIHPVTFTVLGLAAIGYCTYKVLHTRKKLKLLKQGMDGEKAVGQYLELLREKGCAVFHDIDCGGFNLDHVIISERGIFVVETKTLSKPVRGNPTIKYDVSGITAGNVRLNPNPVEQVRAGADWLRQLLSESTGKKFQVRSAVVFPGWYVESSAPHGADGTWVMNPKGLPAFIKNEPYSISREDKKLAAYHLSRYIRTT